MKPAEINPMANESARRFINVSREYVLILLVAICVIITIANFFSSGRAIETAMEARVMVEVELRFTRAEFQELRSDVGIARIRAAKIEAWLTAHGINVEEITK